MDQNIPRDDASGAQPPADSGGETTAWNQAPGQDQSAPVAGSGQQPPVDQAAWSPAQPANPADTQPYTAPQPQSATYSGQPAPAADAQQQYAQQAYAQQQYAQQPYAQQPAQDPAAYAQQQGQQPQYQQPQYYDPNAPQQPQYQQPQYYDPSVYQQPGYYDQSAYGQQQQYQQGAYQQPPAQPYAYAQPGQEPWPGQDAYYDQGATGYGRSFIAVLAAFALLTWGIAIAMGGGLVLWTNSVLDLVGDATLSAEMTELVNDAENSIVAVGGILIILGIMHMIGAVGILAHRNWGRAFGIVLGLLGVVLGLGIIFAAVGFEALDVGLETAMDGEEASLAGGIFVFATYLLILVAMFTGKRQFRKKGVQS